MRRHFLPAALAAVLLGATGTAALAQGTPAPGAAPEPATTKAAEQNNDDGFDLGWLGLLGLAGLAGLKKRKHETHVGTANRTGH